MNPQDSSVPPRRAAVVRRTAEPLPKLCGGDFELGNFLDGVSRPEGTGYWASRAVLAEMPGVVPEDATGSVAGDRDEEARLEAAGAAGLEHLPGELSQDWGRKFLFNGGCAYIDLNHLEICLPEVLSARDHVSYSHALYALAQQAADRLNERLAESGLAVHLLANNSDRLGHSYGSHLNFLLARRTWENLFHRRLQQQLYLASYQASSLVFTGQGKVGTENGAAAPGTVVFQLSQRADFMEVLAGPQTTYRRPVVNSRDEPLTGSWRFAAPDPPASRELSRLHCIFYDHNLCHVAHFLKVGVLQIILSLIETGDTPIQLALEDPVGAVRVWSQDPSLRARATLINGQSVTALDLQRRFLDQATRFVERGGCDGVVPDAPEIIRRWSEVLSDLENLRLEKLAPRLDWVLKYTLLERTLRRRPDLNWASPEIRHLDQLYASLHPAQGLYWACERTGYVERLVAEKTIARCMHEPPPGTRAWTRAALLLLSGPGELESIDWDYLRFRLADPGSPRQGSVSRVFLLHLPDPLGHNKTALDQLLPEAGNLTDALVRLGASPEPPCPAALPPIPIHWIRPASLPAPGKPGVKDAIPDP